MKDRNEWFTIEYQQWQQWNHASEHSSLAEAEDALALDLKVMQQKTRRIVKHTVIKHCGQ